MAAIAAAPAACGWAAQHRACPASAPRPGVLRPAARTPQQTSRQHARRCTAVPRLAVQAAAAGAEIAELNEQFGIPGHVEVFKGLGGQPTVRLSHACGASAEINLFGACVTSFKQASGDEVLYMRPDSLAILASDNPKSKPISGGIPWCFPQFGPGPMQQHGFARNVDWEISSSSADPQPDDRDPEVTLVLTDSEYSRSMWPHKFKVAYSVALHGELLRADVRVMNTDDQPFEFTAALHTYVEVADIEKAEVHGLKGLEYLDKTADPKTPVKKTEDREAITFSGSLVDSVYLNARDYVELHVGTGAVVTFTSNVWDAVVVWNPGSAGMRDMFPQLCVRRDRSRAQISAGPSGWTLRRRNGPSRTRVAEFESRCMMLSAATPYYVHLIAGERGGGCTPNERRLRHWHQWRRRPRASLSGLCAASTFAPFASFGCPSGACKPRLRHPNPFRTQRASRACRPPPLASPSSRVCGREAQAQPSKGACASAFCSRLSAPGALTSALYAPCRQRATCQPPCSHRRRFGAGRPPRRAGMMRALAWRRSLSLVPLNAGVGSGSAFAQAKLVVPARSFSPEPKEETEGGKGMSLSERERLVRVEAYLEVELKHMSQTLQDIKDAIHNLDSKLDSKIDAVKNDVGVLMQGGTDHQKTQAEELRALVLWRKGIITAASFMGAVAGSLMAAAGVYIKLSG